MASTKKPNTDATYCTMPFVNQLAAFVSYLRQHGIAEHANALHDATCAVDLKLFYSRSQFQSALRCLLCHDKKQWIEFNQLFHNFWQPVVEQNENMFSTSNVAADASARQDGIASMIGFGGTSASETAAQAQGAGDYKALSLADFRFVFDPQQQQAIAVMVAELARRARRRYLRRMIVRRKGQHIALGASARNAIRTAGDVVRFSYHKKRKQLPRFVLLLDVSQSMDIYARTFLRFTRQLMAQFDNSEAFAFDTSLIYLGCGHRSLSEQNFEFSINSAATGWLGGTRIAESFREFNQTYLQRCINHQTLVIIFSDGYDTEAVDVLKTQLSPIHRRCKRLVWVNPLLGRYQAGESDPRMDPLQSNIDQYVSAHNLDSLSRLSRILLS